MHLYLYTIGIARRLHNNLSNLWKGKIINGPTKSSYKSEYKLSDIVGCIEDQENLLTKRWLDAFKIDRRLRESQQRDYIYIYSCLTNWQLKITGVSFSTELLKVRNLAGKIRSAVRSHYRPEPQQSPSPSKITHRASGHIIVCFRQVAVFIGLLTAGSCFSEKDIK